MIERIRKALYVVEGVPSKNILKDENIQLNNSGKGRLSRRGFIGRLVSLSITAKLAGVLTACVGTPGPEDGQTKSLKAYTHVGALGDFPLKIGKRVIVKDRPVIVANTQDAGLKAFSAICTHEGCIVGWNKVGGYIECPCHMGSYNPRTGRVLSGPPPRSLPPYELEVRGDGVYVGKPLGFLYSNS